MLTVENASAGYGGLDVVRGVDLEIREGEIVALIGANGAGKSTFVKALSGLLPLRGGTIRLAGTDISKTSTARRLALGLAHVPEGRQLFPGLTVEQNLDLGGYGARDRAGLRERKAWVCETFPALRPRLATFAGNLSGGQQQMVALGRGLMSSPKLIMLDEPSLGLAPLVVREIFELIERLRDGGVSVLLAEQNARMSLAIADRGYVFETGRVALEGRARELLADPRTSEQYFGKGSTHETTTARVETAARLRRVLAGVRGRAAGDQKPTVGEGEAGA